MVNSEKKKNFFNILTTIVFFNILTTIVFVWWAEVKITVVITVALKSMWEHSRRICEMMLQWLILRLHIWPREPVGYIFRAICTHDHYQVNGGNHAYFITIKKKQKLRNRSYVFRIWSQKIDTNIFFLQKPNACPELQSGIPWKILQYVYFKNSLSFYNGYKIYIIQKSSV